MDSLRYVAPRQAICDNGALAEGIGRKIEGQEGSTWVRLWEGPSKVSRNFVALGFVCDTVFVRLVWGGF